MIAIDGLKLINELIINFHRLQRGKSLDVKDIILAVMQTLWIHFSLRNQIHTSDKILGISMGQWVSHPVEKDKGYIRYEQDKNTSNRNTFIQKR